MSTAYAPVTSSHHRQPPAHANSHSQSDSQSKCVIYPNTVTPEGHVLVQVHARQANGQVVAQKYHVLPSEIQAFMQQQRQMYPYMQFVKHGDAVQPSRTNIPPQSQPQSQPQSTSGAGGGVGVYDKYDMSYSSCHFDHDLTSQSQHLDRMSNAHAVTANTDRSADNC
jgi:hypothetical protein